VPILQGYAVVDNVFGSQTVQQLKQELLSVYDQGLMHLNHTHLVSKGATKLLPKSQIHEAELTLDPSVQAAAPMIAQLNSDRTLATMLNLHVPQLRLESQAIKMQHNEGDREPMWCALSQPWLQSMRADTQRGAPHRVSATVGQIACSLSLPAMQTECSRWRLLNVMVAFDCHAVASNCHAVAPDCRGVASTCHVAAQANTPTCIKPTGP
jgi:hypothetical protein